MKRIILSILTVVLAVGLVGGGALAYFRDAETSNDNTFTAGMLDLAVDLSSGDTVIFDPMDIDGTDTKFFEYLPIDKPLAPGDSGQVTLSLHLKDITTINADLWMQVTDLVNIDVPNPEPENSETNKDEAISDNILTKVWLDDDHDSVQDPGELPIIDGSLDTLVSLGKFPVAYNVAGGQTRYVGWSWELPSGVGNESQGDTCTFTVILGADQVTTYSLIMEVVGTGIVSPAAGVYSYPPGAEVPVSYTELPGWGFSGWSINVVAGKVTMNGPQTVTATFVDIAPPTVVLSSTASPGPTDVNPIPMNGTFSEAVSGFTSGDITVVNGTINNFGTLDNIAYTFDVIPNHPGGEDSITVDIAAVVAKDLAGNDNTAAAPFSIYYDGSTPSVESIAVRDLMIDEADVASDFDVTVTFSEKMNTSFTPAISFAANVVASGTLTFDSGVWSAGDTVYTATYNVSDADEEEADVDVSVAGAKDMIGNVIPITAELDLFDVDTISVRELTVTGITASNKIYDGGIVATLNGLGGAPADTASTRPTAHTTGGVDNAGNAYDSDADWNTSYATWGSSSDSADFTTFNMSIPAGATINTVTLNLTGSLSSSWTSRQLLVSVSSDGTNFSSTEQTAFSTSTTTQSLDGTSPLWGLSWTADSFNNNSFKVRIGATDWWIGSDRLFNLTATVNYTPLATATLVGVEPGDTVTLNTSGAAGQFDTENVGDAKTVSVSGLTIGGLDAAKYTLTQPTATANIAVRPITVTAVTSTKPYDQTTSSSGVPTITLGSLASGDSATWTQTYSTANAGTGKTITPAGTVNDGNGGNNYNVTFVNNTTGVINGRAITVTAVTDTKGYDGTATSVGVPTITSGTLLSGDTAIWTQSFNNDNYGTSKTLTPAGTVSDGNGGNNYAVTFATATGVINKRPITVTAVTDTKGYDGTVTSAGVPTITSGTLASGDSATWTQSYDSATVGTGKTLTPAGTVSDGNGGANYAVSFVINTTGVITAASTTTNTNLSSSTINLGASVTDTATVTSSGGTPSGTVDFQVSTDGGTTFAKYGTTKTLSGGSAISDSYTPTAVGAYYFRAVYSGSANYNGSQSGNTAEQLTVNNAVVSYLGAGAIATAANGNVTPVLPSGWQVNDIFICVIASEDNVDSTMPAGWTVIDDGTNNNSGGGNFRSTSYWRRAQSGDTNPTVSHNSGSSDQEIAAVIVAYRGCTTTGSPIDATGTIVANGYGTTLSFGTGVSTSVANAMLVEIGQVRDYNRSAGTYNGSPTPTERIDGPSTNGYPRLVVADSLRSSSGATGARQCTLSGDTRSNGIMIALKP
jgi:predicted ribosomally synthesized peptide with SipW-like signal peptide